jgi:uncharacterized membrane protein
LEINQEEKVSKFYLSLIDVVYGLILSASFLNVERIIFPTSKLLNVEGATLAFGAFFVYYVIISGWYGLHRSIIKNSFSLKTNWSKIRFALNLLIIFLEFYLVALATGVIVNVSSSEPNLNIINQAFKGSDSSVLNIYGNQTALNIINQAFKGNYSEIFMWVIPAIYAAYAFWDLAKILEFIDDTDEKKKDEIKKRTRHTIYIMSCFIIIGVIYWYFYYITDSIKDLHDNIPFIGVSFVLIMFYRIVLKPSK